MNALPADEAQAGYCVQRALYDLARYTDELAVAIELFSESWAGLQATRQTNDKTALWWVCHIRSQIAARDAALTIWHFGEAMNGIKATCRSAPTLNGLCDWQTSRRATNLYKISFPDADGIRDAIAHTANLTETPNKTKENSTRRGFSYPGLKAEPGAEVLVRGETFSDRYVYTWKGRTCSCEISRTALNKLIAVRNTFYSAFARVRVIFPSISRFDGPERSG